ncbi:hypothetical protein FRB94_004319 [Tulasnella sp. JGI-2019a]|nr:hypothetical protein FRB93_000320 [Tulasnella sp. JGI-2019a]KAG9015200.1 hypothetical protein FRB94_004319 [Tulasnella sp. JGI-2019a]
MLPTPLFVVGLVTSLAISAFALPSPPPIKILQGNDDGWAEANVRQLYFDLKSNGYNTLLSAPAYDQSGRGSLDLPLHSVIPLLVIPAEYNSVPAFRPSIGHNTSDDRLNYVASFPVTAMKYGLQKLAQSVLGGSPDIVLSGPNVGGNIGPQDQFSGTIGVAAAAAVSYGIPAIAFSGADRTKRPYTDLRPGDISHLYSALSMTILSQVLASGKPYLPTNTFLNINFPKPSDACLAASAFKFILTTSEPVPSGQAVQCGGAIIPDEATVIASECRVSITAMTSESALMIKKDVSLDVQRQVQAKLAPILSCYNA